MTGSDTHVTHYAQRVCALPARPAGALLPAPVDAAAVPALHLPCFGDISATAAALQDAIMPALLHSGAGPAAEKKKAAALLCALAPHTALRAAVPLGAGRPALGPTPDSPMQVVTRPAVAPAAPPPKPAAPERHLPAPANSGGTCGSRLSPAVWLPTPGAGDEARAGRELFEGHPLPLSFLRSLGCC